jgi:hypothetical protein
MPQIDRWKKKNIPMLNLRLTTSQAQALHDLRSLTNIEPQLIDRPLQNIFHPLTDHVLWPVLDDLRQQLQLVHLKFKEAAIAHR